MTNKNNKPIKLEPQKPNALLYWLLTPIARIYAKIRFRATIVKDREIAKIKGPFIAIGTHSSPLDVVFMLTALMPRRLNIVCGRDVFTWKPVKPIAKTAGLIPISQFSMDLNSIRMIKKAIDNGCSLSLFPEGKITLDGRPMHFISESLAKLLKLLNVPVVMCHNFGGYSTKPKWFKGFKRGLVTQRIKLLFTKEQLQTLPINDIHTVLKDAFSYNDHQYQREFDIKFKSKTPARGLNYILYKCPRCGVEYEMHSSDTELSCANCGNLVVYNEYGKLIPKGDSVSFEGIDYWYDYQRESVRKELENPDFSISYPVVWEVSVDNVYTEKGEGTLTLNLEHLSFCGKDFNGNEVNISAATKNLFTIVQKIKEAVDLTVDGTVNRFYFRDGKYSVKYTIAVEEIYKKIHNL